MKSRNWRAVANWCVEGPLTRPLLEWWSARRGETRVDCFQQGMLEMVEFNDNQAGYSEAM